MGGRRREGRGGLPGNVAEEAFCLKSAPELDARREVHQPPAIACHVFLERSVSRLLRTSPSFPSTIRFNQIQC